MNHIYRSIWSDALGTWIAVSEQCKSKGKGKRSSTALLMTGLLLASSNSWSLPTGDQLVAGQATVTTPNANTLQINQASQNAIINWQSFSVEQNQAVNIQQPNTQAALLNRVVGQDASQIQGQINANGQVYLVNPNGVLFSKTAQVDVGGLVATTHDIKNQDFMNGKNHFTQNGATGKVENHGTINAKSGGVVALIGSSVTNTGSINTPNGTTALAAGKTVDLDFQGNGLIEVKVSEAALNAQITNKGAIIADGGRVMMSAKAAGQLIDTVINQDGLVKARGMIERNGEIILDGGDNGVVKVTGTLDAGSTNLGLDSKGGNIKVTGKDVQINNGAIVTASGNTGGGNINIGDKQTSQTTSIEDGATVTAQALNSGTAGTINILANMDSGKVLMAGTLDASAPNNGNGGFIDTSAARVKTMDTTKVNTQAANGKTGTWLIDPNDFIIGIGGDITGTALANNLATSNVTIISTQGATILGNGDIFVNEAVSYSSANSLTLNALRSINVNSPISNTGTGSVNLRADFRGACVTGATNCGTVNFQGAGSITANTVNIYYNPVSIGTPADYSSFVIGSLNDYMLINDVNQLQAINSYPSGTYALGKDIDASATSTWNSGAGFIPISGGEGGFYGIFDGLNHTITGLTINLPTTISPVGLFGRVESEGIIRNVGLIGGSVRGSTNVGSLVGTNSGRLNNVYATGNVTGSNNVGGLVGTSGGFFSSAGSISTAYATGNVTGNNNVGGLIGQSGDSMGGAASVDNVYATGSVNGTSNIGGLVGMNMNMLINNAYAMGSVIGVSNAGGLAGTNEGTISNSFWNTQTTAQSIGVGQGNTTGVTGKTTAEMQQLATFSSAGWSIVNTGGSSAIWRIYEGNTAPLLSYWLKPLTINANVTETYNGLIHNSLANASFSIPNALSSGNLFSNDPFFGANAVNVGIYPLTTNLYSNQQGFNISSFGSLQITPANLTITANNASKTYGQQLNFAGTEFVSNGLQNGETIGSVNLASTGAIATAPVAGNPYAITATNPVGGTFSASNYAITFNDGLLSINPAALSITANNLSKIYGQLLNFTGTEFVSNGLQNGETIGSVSLASAGVSATAPVAGNPYTITAANPTGGTFSASNYAITFTDGLLSVNPAALSITANNLSKIYGQLLNFTGTEFVSNGLQNGETIGSVNLASTGAIATAPVVGNPYTITASNAAGGTFNASNYAITFNDGLLTVNPAALSITANNANKTYGQLLNFTGTEFVSSGLQNGETIGSVTLASAGVSATAPVAGNPYTITASNAAGGTFSASNYAITFNNSALTVNPAALSITANNASKTYGQLLNFTGTEFVGNGLQNGETIGSVSLASAGAIATASVVGNPYAITATNPVGGTFNASNYTITFNNGLLSVNPAALSITANNASKIYGQQLNFAGTEFISSGLQNGETIDSVTLASAGVSATAPVTDNPYTITATNPTGGTFSASNYAITFNNGLLSVNPAALSITANNASKIFGQTLNFTGTEFISSGLQNGETIGSVNLASLGAVATASVEGSPYTITPSNAAGGTFSPSNYTITYNDGLLTINPAALNPVALRITDQSNATLQDNIVGLVGRNFSTNNWFNNTSTETKEPEAELVRIDDNSDNFTGYPNNNLFRLIDLARDDKKRIVPKLKYKNSAGRVKVLHVSDDGQFLSLLLEDGTVRVWDLQRGVQRNMVDPKQTRALTDIGEVNDKGELLSIAGTTGIGTYNIIGAINDDKLSIKGRDVNHFANSSDGNLLLVNLGANNMRLWDNAQRKELWQLQSQRGEVKDLIMSDDRLRAAVLTRQEGVYVYDAKLGKLKQITDAIDIIDMKTGKITTSLPNVLDQVVYLSFKDNDILQVGLANGELQNWSLSTRSKKSTGILVEKLKTVDNLGETYAYTTTTGIARVGDAQGNVQLSIENKDNLITDARLLAKGEKLLTVFETGDLALWDIASGKKMLRLFSSKQGGWTVMDAFGRFDGSEDAMENFDWIAENDTIPLDNFSENYYEPGLLATILQEQDYFNNDSNRIIDGISLPPKVDLQLIAQQAENDKVAVQLNVFDRGGGINKVSIYHNGKLINHDNLVVVPTNGDAEQRSLTLQLSPNAGKNTLKVVASNELGIENSGTEISFDGKTKAYDSAMRLMSVGINKYSDRNLNLSYSVADAQLIEKTLKNSGKLLASKVLIDQQATKPHILAQLKELSQGAQQDVLIIYLAGHGVALGKEWYFLPHETKMQTNIEQTVNTGITATELSDIFKDSKIQHIFLMVDSCYSGAGMEAFNKLENGQRYLSRRLGRSLGITVVTAAAKNQEAAELKSLGHGVFTYLMSEEMQKQQTNEPITAHGIAQHISDTLPIISKQMTGISQDPAIYIKGNNFILSDVAKDKK